MYIINNIRQRWTRLQSRVEAGSHLLPLAASEQTSHCLNCGTDFVGHYCPNCGQKATIQRLSLRQGLYDLLDIFTNFESGFFHTCVELIYRPGYMMRDYINGHRKEYVKPLKLLFLLGTLLLVLSFLLYGHGFDNVTAVSEDVIKEHGHERFFRMFEQIVQWLNANRAALYLMMVTLLVLPNWLMFYRVKKEKRLNISEHFFVMVYVGCQLLMLQIVQMPFERLLGESQDMSLGIPTLILVYDFHQLYKTSVRSTLFRCIVSSLFALILLIVALIICVLIVVYVTGETELIFE